MKKLLIFLAVFILVVLINADIKSTGNGKVRLSIKPNGVIKNFLTEAISGEFSTKINAKEELSKLAQKDIDFEKLYFVRVEKGDYIKYRWSDYDINKYSQIQEKIQKEADKEKINFYKEELSKMKFDYERRIEYTVEVKDNKNICNTRIINKKRETYKNQAKRAYYEVNLRLKEIAKKEINKFTDYEVDTTTLDEQISYYDDSEIFFIWTNKKSSLNNDRKLRFIVGFKLKDLKDLSKLNDEKLEYELIYLSKLNLDKDFYYKNEYKDYNKEKLAKIAQEFLQNTDYVDGSKLKLRGYKDSKQSEVTFLVEFIYGYDEYNREKIIRVEMDKHFNIPKGIYKY